MGLKAGVSQQAGFTWPLALIYSAPTQSCSSSGVKASDSRINSQSPPKLSHSIRLRQLWKPGTLKVLRKPRTTRLFPWTIDAVITQGPDAANTCNPRTQRDGSWDGDQLRGLHSELKDTGGYVQRRASNKQQQIIKNATAKNNTIKTRLSLALRQYRIIMSCSGVWNRDKRGGSKV